ncbi:contact-dependent growth inhibition system immunity protein [Herbaspirillum chlorophenolicum]|uniref:contact-dependent growth inhibition system immunity protein n=1 Tax=Herbaspirillum chlorophenolicum TaxID=211589 RepID=UPI0009E5B84A|nr:contact-dependent growth inhibition system immunity protein [Herbaspirillum chlorophenolicum]
MEKPSASANVGFNGDFYRFTTMSRGMLGYAEPSVSPCFLAPFVDNEALGNALRNALSESRLVSAEEFQKIFHSGIVQELEKKRDVEAMKTYGYKTKRALYEKMDFCSVSLFEHQIEIQPTHKKSLDGWTVKRDEGPFSLYVPKSAADEELGAALREGFTRCTR